MDHAARTIIVQYWQDLRDYARNLVADLSAHDMIAQPVPAVTMNHPAWILAHLSIYAPVLHAVVANEPVEDPLNHRYGRNSKPEADANEYPSKTELLDAFCNGFDRAADAFLAATDTHLASTMPVERWQQRFPTVAHLPLHLLINHNATHLGQLSAWRRAGGRPPV